MHTDECLTMKSWHQSRIATSRVPSLLIVSKSPVRSTQQGAKTEIAEGRKTLMRTSPATIERESRLQWHAISLAVWW